MGTHPLLTTTVNQHRQLHSKVRLFATGHSFQSPDFSNLSTMPRNFSVVEPHPSVVNHGGYIGSGIGGAGNYKHYNRAELTPGPSAQGPAARIPLKKRPDRVVPCGRGGAGNMRRVTNSPEPEMFQFDEEMMKQRETAAPTYHIGRGGAANFVDEMKPRTNRMGSTGSDMSVNSDRSEASSVRSRMEGTFNRLTRKISNR